MKHGSGDLSAWTQVSNDHDFGRRGHVVDDHLAKQRSDDTGVADIQSGVAVDALAGGFSACGYFTGRRIVVVMAPSRVIH